MYSHAQRRYYGPLRTRQSRHKGRRVTLVPASKVERTHEAPRHFSIADRRRAHRDVCLPSLRLLAVCLEGARRREASLTSLHFRKGMQKRAQGHRVDARKEVSGTLSSGRKLRGIPLNDCLTRQPATLAAKIPACLRWMRTSSRAATTSRPVGSQRGHCPGMHFRSAAARGPPDGNSTLQRRGNDCCEVWLFCTSR